MGVAAPLCAVGAARAVVGGGLAGLGALQASRPRRAMAVPIDRQALPWLPAKRDRSPASGAWPVAAESPGMLPLGMLRSSWLESGPLSMLLSPRARQQPGVIPASTRLARLGNAMPGG